MKSVNKSYSLKEEICSRIESLGFTVDEGEENIFGTKYIIHIHAPDTTLPMYIYETGLYTILVDDQRFFGATIEDFDKDFHEILDKFDGNESSLFESILHNS